MNRITFNSTSVIRLILDNAMNVYEAKVLLREYNYYFSGDINVQYLLSDKSGESVIVAFEDKEVVFTESSENYRIATNFK